MKLTNIQDPIQKAKMSKVSNKKTVDLDESKIEDELDSD
jgi:hypothetical protein